jgi:hypothetical protein
LTPEEADVLQRRYSANRKRWARRIGIPVNGDLENPDPGELDAVDPEEG